jgi:hypothetical protein
VFTASVEKLGAPTAREPASVAAFIKKWGLDGKAHKLSERSGAQTHFLELCDLLGVEKPSDNPGDAESYCFERSMKGVTGEVRYADVWKRGCFAWEYKRPAATPKEQLESLRGALEQLMRYTLPLENPPLLVVSDRQRIEVHTHFTGYPTRCTAFSLQDLADRKVIARLRDVFLDPYSFRPEHNSRQVTEGAAAAFASIADALRAEGIPAQKAAHFLTQCVFCYFAEDIGLLSSFKRVVLKRSAPVVLQASLTELFLKMQKGGTFGADDIPWFNGGLFNKIDVPLMPVDAIKTLAEVAEMGWSAIDPSVFGTLFERGLDPSKRAQLGAFYTSPSIIVRLVTPVVERTLVAEWEQSKAKINGLLSERDFLRVRAKSIPSTTEKLDKRHSRIRTAANKAEREAKDIFNAYLERLRDFRVLDPACGSGNFLYLSLKALKDVEKQANLDAETLGLQPQLPVTGPQNVLGIELNEYAAELARMTVWIGELQWRKQNGYGWKLNPVLDPLDHIECRDALLTRTASGYVEAEWPEADVIVGNPPFIGNKKMRDELGDAYTEALRETFQDALPEGVDLVCYWFEKSRKAIGDGRAYAAGLVGTQAVRHGSSRTVLDDICKSGSIFEAWSDEPWVNEGAAVRVSLVCFGRSFEGTPRLDGAPVERIAPNLSGLTDLDITKAQRLPQNMGVAFQGPVKVGAFDVSGDIARQWLRLPNPNGKSNAAVLRPYVNGLDLTRRPTDMWIIDFGATMGEEDAALFEAPFAHVRRYVRPMRLAQRRESRAKWWWRHGETVPGLRRELAGISRYAVTPRVAKYRTWSWRTSICLPDSAVVAVMRGDDMTFGILESRYHRVWSLATGSALEDRPRYTPTTCFETFPFPSGLAPAETSQSTEDWKGALIPAGLSPDRKVKAGAVALSAKRVSDLREQWLNPIHWTRRVPEMVPLGREKTPYPERSLPFETLAAADSKELERRTLTNLYNESPEWLTLAHQALDKAVAALYGWDYASLRSDEDVLRLLLVENQDRQEK